MLQVIMYRYAYTTSILHIWIEYHCGYMQSLSFVMLTSKSKLFNTQRVKALL